MLNDEPAERVTSALRAARGPIISAATLFELMIVSASRLGAQGPDAARAVLDEADVVTVPVDELSAELALEAWMNFGKGRHPAELNLSDCYSYTAARHFEVPLLFVGRDFARTDLLLIDATVE